MQRTVLIGLGILVSIGAWFMFRAGGPIVTVIIMLINGAALTVGIVLERTRYKRILDRPPSGFGWVDTGERFVDPGTGRMVTVFSRPDTGERQYVGAPEVMPS